MVKAILFDFWGTLVENGVWSPIKQVRNILQIRMPFPAYVVRMEKAMMTKDFNELKDCFTAIAKEFEITPTDDQYQQLIGMWNKSWMLAKPYEEVKEMLKKLREKYDLILICNTDSFSLPRVLEKFDLDEYFNRKYLSYEIEKIKTDPDFLKIVLRDLDLNPEEVILVGDSLQSDMNAAKAVGIKSILIDRKNTRDFHPKIQTLKELETVIYSLE